MKAALVFLIFATSVLAGPVDLIKNTAPTSGKFICKTGNLEIIICPGVATNDDTAVVFWLMPFTVAIHNSGKETVNLPITSFYMKDDTGFSVDFLKRDDAMSIIRGGAKSGAGKSANMWMSVLVGEKAASQNMNESSEKAQIALMKVPEADIMIRPGEKKIVMMVTPVLSEKATSFSVVCAPDGSEPVEMAFGKLEPINGEKYAKTKQILGASCLDTELTKVGYEVGNKTAKAWGLKTNDVITAVKVNEEETAILSRNQLEALLRTVPTDAKLSLTIVRNKSPLTLELPSADTTKTTTE